MIQEKLADMAISIYGAESAAYRTAGEIDDAIKLASKESMVHKIADFALECALNKVNCSEALGKIVDEAVQIHGGYGYMQDYEVERLYRDARISRIFEGTNEINRLTIAKMLYKKYTLAPSTYNAPSAEQPAEINQQYIQLSNYLMQVALAVITDAQIHLEQEQEYMRLLADMAKDLYVMEASLLRTVKNANEKTKYLMTDIICQEGYRKIEKSTIDIICAAETNEQKRKIWLDAIQQLNIPLHQNLFMKKREIARNIINNPKSIS